MRHLNRTATPPNDRDLPSRAVCAHYPGATGCFHSTCPAHRAEMYALMASKHAADTVTAI